MDVDLLRPGTVPISPDTILWFEFLLSENLLLNHLQKPIPDPSPIELICKFTSVVFESSNNDIKRIDLENGDSKESVFDEKPKYSLKHLALKVLSLKVAAHVKWNLDVLRALPFKFQLNVLQDLMYFTNNQTFAEIPNIPDYDNISTLPQPYLFALIIYHRWVVRIALNHVFGGQLKIFGNIDVSSLEETILRAPENIQRSLVFLTEALNWVQVPSLLTFDCFVMLTEHNSEIQNDWNEALPISKEEFCAQIAYDLAVFYFFKENYETATLYFSNCLQCYKKIVSRTGFLTVDWDELQGYLIACNTVVEGANSLLQQFHISIVNQYMSILNILQQDNIYKKIPMSYRINLELDIHGALSSGKFTVARDLLPKIKALNAIRSILDKDSTYHYDINLSNADIFIWAVSPILKICNGEDRRNIHTFLIQAILRQKTPEILNKLRVNDMLADLLKTDIEKISSLLSTNIKIANLLVHTEKEFCEYGNMHKPRLEVRSLEQELISCYDSQIIRQLLVKITSKSTSRPVWRINPCWELPIPLQSVLVGMPKGFLQDFSFILLAKSRELMLSKNWNLSLELLKILKTEVQLGTGNTIPKLTRLISWEVLLIKINQLLEQWPAPDIDKKELALECEACLQTGESILPRTEIMEHCALCLLSLGRWELLAGLEKRWTYFEIAATIASSCQDLIKFKGNKKLSRDLWDFVLPVFGASPLQSKRSSSGNTSVIHRDSPITSTKIQLVSFFLRLRDTTVLTVVISMLARLHNVLRDESSLELNVDYIMLWPAVVSNSNSYNSKAVLEVLMEIVLKALHYYPTNVPWMRLMGDINFISGHNEESLNCYLKSLLLASDNFTLPLRNDDHIIRRMIKSCSALNCHTQAAVLCQFLEEPDYASAFHSLAEQKLCSDATDAYYHCFWDTSILEYLVNLHHKRAEFQRRKHAVQVMGLLELNSNNNEEIQHEASTLRKNIFLRALSKQYLH